MLSWVGWGLHRVTLLGLQDAKSDMVFLQNLVRPLGKKQSKAAPSEVCLAKVLAVQLKSSSYSGLPVRGSTIDRSTLDMSSKSFS